MLTPQDKVMCTGLNGGRELKHIGRSENPPYNQGLMVSYIPQLWRNFKEEKSLLCLVFLLNIMIPLLRHRRLFFWFHLKRDISICLPGVVFNLKLKTLTRIHGQDIETA